MAYLRGSRANNEAGVEGSKISRSTWRVLLWMEEIPHMPSAFRYSTASSKLIRRLWYYDYSRNQGPECWELWVRGSMFQDEGLKAFSLEF